MRKRLLLLSLLISFSVPVVAHNEFNGGVGSAPNFETIQEKRLELINKRYYKTQEALKFTYETLKNRYGSSPTKAQQKKLQMLIITMNKVDERFNNKIKRINDRDGKRIKVPDGKRYGDSNLKKKIKKKLGK